MLDQLIALTNQTDFWCNWHLRLEHAHFSTETFTFIVSTEMDADTPTEETLQWWEVTCNGVVEEKIIDRLHLPNSTVSLFDDHPLLWKYEKSTILRITGKHISVSKLLGDLFQIHLKVTGNWIDFQQLAGGLYWNLEKKGIADMLVPERLLPAYQPILQDYGLMVKVEDGWEGEENLKVLLIGNCNTSPDNYSFGQAYVIGKEFTVKTVAPNSGFLQ